MNVKLALILALMLPAFPVERCALPGEIQEASSVSVKELRSAPAVLMLDNRSLSLSADAWRDFMPTSPGSADGSPLMVALKIASVDKQPLPGGMRLDRAWVFFGEQTWEATYFRDQRPGQALDKDGWVNCPNLPTCQATIRGGPRWGPGVFIDVVVRLTDREGKQHFLQAPHLRVQRAD